MTSAAPWSRRPLCSCLTTGISCWSMTRVSTFDRLRHLRHPGVWCFVVLLLLVSAERRLAELHFNLRTAETGIESEDSLDADEIRTRLILLQDEKLPTVPVVGERVAAAVAPCWRLAIAFALHAPSPRGPPVRSPSFA